MTASSHRIVKKLRKGTASSLDRILTSITAAGGFGELRPLLSALSRETERIIGSHPLTLEEASRLADLLTHIRMLLKQAAHEGNLRGDEDMLTCYRELEGAVKEIRNDLGRTAVRAYR